MEGILRSLVEDKVLFIGCMLTLLLIIIIVVTLVRRSKKLKRLEKIVEKEPLEEIEKPKIKEINNVSKPVNEIPKLDKQIITPTENVKEEETKNEIIKEEKLVVENDVSDLKNSNETAKVENKNYEQEAKIEVENKMKEASKNNEVTEYKKEKSELEKMLDQMQEDLNKRQDSISSFEEEQEENSVISYQELVNKLKGQTNNSKKEEVKVKQEEINKIISNEEVKPVENNIELKKEVIVKEEVKEKQEPVRSFKQTEFISPIYGKVDNNKTSLSLKKEKLSSLNSKNLYEKKYEIEETKGNNVELEKTLKMPPISKEIKRNEDFLRALKDFRNNL